MGAEERFKVIRERLDLDALRAGIDLETLTVKALRESVATCTHECGTPKWRGLLCEYHQGFEDGVDVLGESIAAALASGASSDGGET